MKRRGPGWAGLRARLSLAALVGTVLAPVVLIQSAQPSPPTSFSSIISKNSAGLQGPGQSDSPAQSADGRWTAFVSDNDLTANPPTARGTRQVYLHDRVSKTTTWVSKVAPLAGGDPHFYEAFQPSISADGRHVAFTARPLAASILAVGNPTISSPSGQAGDENLVLPTWYTGETVTLTVADADGTNCSSAADQVAFSGSPAINTASGATGTVTLASSPACPAGVTDQLVVKFTNSGTYSNTIPITGISYSVGTGASLGPVVITTSPNLTNSGTTGASNATIVGGGNSITAAKPPGSVDIARSPGNGSDLTLHLAGWANGQVISILVDDGDVSDGCKNPSNGNLDGVGFASTPVVKAPAAGGPTASINLTNTLDCRNAFTNEVLVTLTNAGTAPGDLTLTNIKYQVAPATTLGSVVVSTDPFLTNSGTPQASNAFISNSLIPGIVPASQVAAAAAPESGGPVSATLVTKPAAAMARPGFQAAAALASSACNQNCEVYVYDLASSTSNLVSTRPATTTPAGGDNFQPSITADGMTVAFTSSSLGATEGGPSTDVFVHERDVDGNPAHLDLPTNTSSVRQSVDVNGRPAFCSNTCGADRPSISADGRVVAFESDEPLTPDGPVSAGVMQVYAHERVSGLTRLESAGVVVGGLRSSANSAATEPSVSGDGRMVAFSSAATNLTAIQPAASQHQQIFVHDRNVDLPISLLSVAPTDETRLSWRFQFDRSGIAVPAGGAGRFRLILQTGQVATGILTSIYTGGKFPGTAVDVTLPTALAPTTAKGLVLAGAVTLPGGQSNPLETTTGQVAGHPNLTGANPAPAPAGATVMRFTFDQPVTVVNPGGLQVFDRTGISSSPVSAISVSGSPDAIDASFSASQIANAVGASVLGGAVASGQSTNLGDEVLAPVTPMNVIASSDSAGVQGTDESSQPSISADGRTVAFTSFANLGGPAHDTRCPSLTSNSAASVRAAVAAGPPRVKDVYARDLATGGTERVSLSSTASAADCDSDSPSISGNGRYVAFHSLATNIDTDTNGATGDVFLGDRLPLLTVNPARYDFGSHLVGTASPPVIVTVTNEGLGAATVTGVSLAGATPTDFTLTSNNCDRKTLLARDTCTVAVVFKPSAGGNRSASVVFANDAGGALTASLTATGTLFSAIRLTPNPLNFGNLAAGQSSSMPVTATNTGEAPLTINTVAIAGANPPEFVITADGCSGHILDPTGTCQLTIRFSPLVGGNRAGTLVVSDSAPGSPHKVPLAGTAPTLAVLPGVGTPGSVITVVGTDWRPNELVELHWDQGLGRQQVKTDANGGFLAQQLILRHDVLGTRHMIAFDGASTLKAPFLAAPGSAEPPRFLIRR